MKANSFPRHVSKARREGRKFKKYGGLGAHGEIVTKGYWMKSRYYKRTDSVFVGECEPIEITDEILHNIHFYKEQLQDYLNNVGRCRDKIEAELFRLDTFINKYSKK